MCGLCGILRSDGRDVDTDVLGRMTRAMEHRGPDGEGFHQAPGVGFGHRRLSIIDLVGGAQPLFNEDRTVAVVANGEIYNYRELMRELEGRGHRFQTRSDTEVIVHLYEEEGIECLNRLRGMFAIAIHDTRKGRVFLARDRFGIKPLYYHESNGVLTFASEIRPLIAAGYSVQVRPQGVHLYLESRFAHGDETMFQGVHRLPEGAVLEWSPNSTSVRTWYENPWHEAVDDDRPFDELFEDSVRSAVQSHMVADVPVGAYLSSGVDSAVLVSDMVRHAEYPVRTFCVDFVGGYREAERAEEIASLLGTQHETIRLGVDELLDMASVVRTLEEPVGDGVVVAQYILSRATRDAGIKTVLTGDGADETLAGYQYLKAILRAVRGGRFLPDLLLSTVAAPLAGRLPLSIVDRLSDLPFNVAAEARKKLSAVLEALPRRDLQELYDLFLGLWLPADRSGIYTADFLQQVNNAPRESFAGTPRGKTLFDQVLSLQYRKWLPANINMKQDRLCMAHSIENRVPFLDHNFVELATTMPERVKIRGKRTKAVLRDLAARRGLANVISEKKVPFHLPLEHYLEDPRLQAFIDDHVHDDIIRRRGYVQPEYVRNLREQSRKLDYLAAKKLFSLVILELWCREFVD